MYCETSKSLDYIKAAIVNSHRGNAIIDESRERMKEWPLDGIPSEAAVMCSQFQKHYCELSRIVKESFSWLDFARFELAHVFCQLVTEENEK